MKPIFIKLTKTDNGGVIYVNVDEIGTVQVNEHGNTRVTTRTGFADRIFAFIVQEKVDYIIQFFTVCNDAV